MTDIIPLPNWSPVRQLETNEYATGGFNGNMNEQATSLAARTELLKNYTALPYETGKTYELNERVQLDNGDIVKSTIAGNTNDPNVSMVGWVNTSDSSQIVDESGNSQQEINDSIEQSIVDINSIGNRVIHGSLTDLLKTNKPTNQPVVLAKPEQIGVSYYQASSTQVTPSPDVVQLNDGRQAVKTNDLNTLKRKVGIFTTPSAFDHRVGALSYIKKSQTDARLITDLSKFKAATSPNASAEFWKEVFIDGANGNDANDGLTWSTAKKTLSGSIGGNFTKVNIKAGIYHVGNCNMSAITKTLDTAWVCDNGVAILSTDISNNVASNWTLHSGTAYAFDMAGAAVTVTSCVDLKSFDSSGNYLSYLYRDTIAEVIAQKGTYTYSAGIAYVNTTDGVAPTKSRILLNTANSFFNISIRPNQKHYLKNLHFVGGTGSVSCVVVKTFNNAVADNSVFFAEGCKFGNIDKRWNVGNAFELFDVDLAILVNCGSGQVAQDGFNYHGYLRDPHVIEVNCYGGNVGTDNNDNCSTAHEGVRIFRIGCDYGVSSGPAVVDVNNAKSYNVCLTAYKGRHNLQFDGAVEAWVNGYVGYQQSINDIYLTSGVAGQSKLHVYDNHTEKPIVGDLIWSIDSAI